MLFRSPEWARTSRVGLFAGADFEPQPDGTLRCPTNHPLYPQERRAEQDGTVRIVYAARIRDCRACRLRVQCLAHGNETKHARRVSAVRRPIEGPSPPPKPTASPRAAAQPILWGDWSRCQTRRRLMSLLRTQTVTITLLPATDPMPSGAERCPLTRQQRKQARLTWEQRLARNALPRIRAWGEASPVRHSTCLRPSHRPSFSRIGMVPVLGSHQARRKGAVSASRRAFFSGYTRDFSHSILLIYNISHFNVLILKRINKRK